MKPDAWQELRDGLVSMATRGWASANGPAPDAPPGFAPFAAAAEGFEAAARAYRSAANAAAGQGDAARLFAHALRGLFADFPVPWKTTLDSALHGVAPGNLFDQPALGASREHQQRGQQLAEAARRVADAQGRLQILWSDAMREAAATFTTRLDSTRGTPAHPAPVGELYNTWIDCAEDAYARMIHGENFCTTLAELVNAASQWRQALQAAMEQSAKLLDLPTRSEIDSLAQRLKAVEHELRAARRAPDDSGQGNATRGKGPTRKRKTASKAAKAAGRSRHGTIRR
ncbi:MAG: poly(R)-hydroxyalkanoic acid synthase subunit PhaE [Steroidobacteraceae bacterium]